MEILSKIFIQSILEKSLSTEIPSFVSTRPDPSSVIYSLVEIRTKYFMVALFVQMNLAYAVARFCLHASSIFKNICKTLMGKEIKRGAHTHVKGVLADFPRVSYSLSRVHHLTYSTTLKYEAFSKPTFTQIMKTCFHFVQVV